MSSNAPTQSPQGMPPGMRAYQLIMGGWSAQLTATVAELGIPDALAGGPVGTADLAAATGSDPAALRRLLRAAGSVDLVRAVDGDRWEITPVGAVLGTDAPMSSRALALMTAAPGSWSVMQHLTDAVRGGGPVAEKVLGASVYDYYSDHPEQREWFDEAMAKGSVFEAGKIVQAYHVPAAARIVDVAGGRGVLLAEFLADRPETSGVLFDRPEVLAGAQGPLAGRGVADRVELVPGDFFREVPAGGDVYLLKYILSDWADEQAATILANCRAAMADDGAVLIVGGVLDESRVSPFDAIFDLQMLAGYGGRLRTVPEYTALLTGAGLTTVRAFPASPYGPVLIEGRP